MKKRMMSLLMCIVMLLGMLPTSVMAGLIIPGGGFGSSFYHSYGFYNGASDDDIRAISEVAGIGEAYLPNETPHWQASSYECLLPVKLSDARGGRTFSAYLDVVVGPDSHGNCDISTMISEISIRDLIDWNMILGDGDARIIVFELLCAAESIPYEGCWFETADTVSTLDFSDYSDYTINLRTGSEEDSAFEDPTGHRLVDAAIYVLTGMANNIHYHEDPVPSGVVMIDSKGWYSPDTTFTDVENDGKYIELPGFHSEQAMEYTSFVVFREPIYSVTIPSYADVGGIIDVALYENDYTPTGDSITNGPAANPSSMLTLENITADQLLKVTLHDGWNAVPAGTTAAVGKPLAGNLNVIIKYKSGSNWTPFEIESSGLQVSVDYDGMSCEWGPYGVDSLFLDYSNITPDGGSTSFWLRGADIGFISELQIQPVFAHALTFDTNTTVKNRDVTELNPQTMANDPVSVTTGSKIPTGTLLDLTAANSSTFDHWVIKNTATNTDVTSSIASGFDPNDDTTTLYMPAYPVTITAEYETAGNTVHFNSMGGSAKDDVTADATSNTLTSAQLAAPSTAPTSSVTGSNRIFTGWYTLNGSGNWDEKVTTDTVFSADTTVYARWADQFIGSGSAVYAALSGTTLTVWGSGTMREGLSGTHTQGTENHWAAGLDEATTVIIEDGVTSIPEYSFWNFENLTSVTIGSGVKSIDKSAFARCPLLQSITIPANVTTIDTDAFGYCDSLTSITVASGNENYYADENGVLFEMCSGMYSDYACLLCYPAGKTATSYTIPETANGKNVTAVYDSAFNGNDHLTSLTISRNLNEICMEKEDFSFCSGCSKLESFAVTSGNQKYTALDNGVLYSHDGTSLTLIRYPENRTGTEYTVGEQVRGVSYGAFEGTKNLEHVMFNAAADKALSLAPYLFSNSSVELVDLYCTDSLDVDDDETFDGYEGDVVAMIDPAALYGLYSLISNGVSVPVVVLTGDWSSDSVQSAVAAMATELQALIASGVRFYWNPLATKWTNSSLPELLTLTSLDEKPTTGSGYIGICGNWFSVPSPTTSPKMNFAVVKDGAPLAFSTVEAALTCNEIDMNVAMGVLASPSPNLMNALPAIGAGKYVESTVTELEGQTASLFRTDVSSGTAYRLSDNRDVFAEYGLNMLLSEEEDSVQSWMLVPTSNAYTVVQTTFYGMPMWALMNDPDAQPVCMLLCAMGIWVLMVNDASAMDNCYICANAVQNTKCGENLTWSYDWFTDTLTIAGTGEMYTYENSVDAPWSDIFSGTGTVVLGEGVTGIDVSALGVTVDFIVVNNPSALESVLEQSDDLSGEYDGVGILLGCDMEEKVDVSKYSLGENRYFLNMPNVTGNEDFTPYQLYFCDQTKAIEEALSGSSYYIPVGLTFYTVNPSAALPSFMLDVDGFGTVEAHVKRSNAKPLQVVATEGGTEKALPLTDDELALTLTPNSGEAIESFELTLGNSGSFSPKTILGNMVGILNSGTYVSYEQAKPVLLAMDAIPPAYASMDISEHMICTIESKAGSGNYVPLTTAGQMFDLFVNKWLKNDEEFEENISIRLTFNLGDSVSAFAQGLYEHGGRFEASFTGGNENVIDSGYCGDPKVNNGHDVTWRLESLPAPYDASDLHLIISGTGDMQDYEDNPTVPGNPNFPWAIYDGGTVGGVGYDIYAITIEDGVTSIGDYALCLTDLRSIVFSSSITDFGTKHSIWYSLNSMPVGLSGTGWTDAKINGLCEALTSSTTINYSECHNCTRDELKATIKSHTYLMPGASMAAGQDMSPTQLYFCDQTTAAAATGAAAANYVYICGEWYTTNSALGELRWRYDDENCILTIYGRGDMEDYEWVDDEDTGKKKTNEPWHYYYDCYHIVVEEGVTGIGEYAFYGYGLVESIALPSTLETIGDNAFGYKYGLTEDARKVNVGLSGSGWTAGKLSMIDDAMDNSVTVRNDENQLVDEARSCSPIIPTYYLLPGATVEDGLTLTGVTQLYEAPGTGGVNICGTTYYTTPSAITGTCGTGVTWSYDRLTKTMTISGSGDMGEPNDTWANFAIEHYVIGAGITTIWGPIISDPYGIINDNTYIVSFDVADGNKNYTSIDGVLLGINKVGGTPDGTLTLLQYPAGKGDARLDDSVEEYVTSYRIPDNVTSIGSNAFASTYLTGLVIPSSVTTFGVSLFGSVQCIVSVGLSGDWSSVASLPENFPNATTYYWMPTTGTGITSTPKTGLFATAPTQLYNCNQSGEHTGGNYVQLCGTWYTTVEPKAAIGNKEYASLADAVAAAVSNDTVSMLSDAEVASDKVLSVSTGKVLDLNGHDLVVNGTMLVTGSVIDSVGGGKLLFKNDPDGDGKEVGASISIDGNATMGIFNGKLPVCTNNNVDGCSEYTMVTYTPAPYGFGYNSTRQQYGVSFRITMDGSDWAKFTEGIYNVKFSIKLDIGGKPRTVEFSKQSIMAAAAGKTASGDQLLYFTLWFNGTDDLSKATTVTATPTITVMIGNSTLYVKELTTKSHTFPATAS